MTQTIIVALLSLIGSLFGTLGGIFASSKLTAFRLDSLERKVEDLGKQMSRSYELEAKDKILEEKIKLLERRLEPLQAKNSKIKETRQFEI